MKEQKYLVTQEQLDSMAAMAAKKAVDAYRAEERKAQKRRENENIRITRKKLQAYRRTKASLAEEIEFTDDEKIELRWAFIKDFMGSDFDGIAKADDRIKTFENKRNRDMFEVQTIDRALELYRREAERSSSDEFRRRYRELCFMYVDEGDLTISDIADIESVSEKIVYRDLGIACSILAVYLLGM